MNAAFRERRKRKQRGIRVQLQRFFEKPIVEVTIGGLIVTSVVLTLVEVSLPPTHPWLGTLDSVNHSITWLFAFELSGRFIAAPSKRRFFREFWVDLIALLPLLRVLRVFRVLRLLRLLRMFRLIGLFSRYARFLPYVLRRGALEYVIVSGLIVLTLVFGTASILSFERSANPELTFGEAFWFNLYAMFAGEPPNEPITFGGHVVTVFVMFMGLSVFAMFTGTVSAFMVERLRREGQVVDWDQFEDHLIICGWNRRAEIIAREYHAAFKNGVKPIVVIAELEGEPEFTDPNLRDTIRFLNEDFTKVAVLEKAGIHRAATCIILSDNTQGRSEQDADARTILAALTVEKLSPDVYTCAELNNREYGSHLEMGQVNDYVVTGEHNGFLLAHAALNQGLMGVFTELLTYERGNQFYRLPVPQEWVGKEFVDLFVHLKKQHGAILIAVHVRQGGFMVNPESHQFAASDHVILIADSEIDW